jgi:argininosuccinate lyase
MLAKVGLISLPECRQIEQGLADIRQEIEQGRFSFSVGLEDIHMHVERALIDRIGDVGRKLHTARSRNDQVDRPAIWVRDEIDHVAQLQSLQRAFVAPNASAHSPRLHHLQRAQPV